MVTASRHTVGKQVGWSEESATQPFLSQCLKAPKTPSGAEITRVGWHDGRTFTREPVRRGDRIKVGGRRCTYVVREKDAEDRRQGPKDFRIHGCCRWRLLALSRRWRLRTWDAWMHEGTVVTGRWSCERRRIATAALSWTRQRTGVQTPPNARVVCTATDVRRRRYVDGGGGSKKYMYDDDANKGRWCDKNKNATNEWTRSRRTTILIGIYYSNYYCYYCKLSGGTPYERNVNLNQWTRMKNGEVGCLIFFFFFPLFSPFFPSLRHTHTHIHTYVLHARTLLDSPRPPTGHSPVQRRVPSHSHAYTHHSLSHAERGSLYPTTAVTGCGGPAARRQRDPGAEARCGGDSIPPFVTPHPTTLAPTFRRNTTSAAPFAGTFTNVTRGKYYVSKCVFNGTPTRFGRRNAFGPGGRAFNALLPTRPTSA